MVYAIFFGFVYQSVNDRVSCLDELVSQESAGIIMILRITLSLPDEIFPSALKYKIAGHCREAVVTMIEDLYGEGEKIHDSSDNMMPGLQAILAELHEAINHLEDEKINSHAKKLALHAIKKIHETVTTSGPTIARRRKQMRHRLSLPEWMFLQTLANFTFFGM